MPDEVSFSGLAGTPDLISDIFYLNLYLYVHTLSVVIMFKLLLTVYFTKAETNKR